MAIASDDPFDIDVPSVGRIHRHQRRVQLADSSPHGRVRLDALARMLQDVSDEDTAEAGFPADQPWVVRRAALRVDVFPTFRDVVEVATWCSGIGGRWAERRVQIRSVRGADQGSADAAVLWVHLDRDGRPSRLPGDFEDLYGSAARGRRVRARLLHEPRPPEEPGTPGNSGPPERSGTERRPFPLRITDVDLMGHVNNAVSWIPLEETLARGTERVRLLASVEHPGPIDVGTEPEVVVATVGPGVGERAPGHDLWICTGGEVCSTGQLRFLA